MRKNYNTVSININDKYFKSNSIDFGRVAKRFFKKFCENYVLQNQNFFEQIKKYDNHLVMPCVACEDCNLSAVVCAIDKITNIHLTEHTFYLEDKPNRRIDLWCRETNNNIPYDFFIELKNHWYCTTTPTMPRETKDRLKKLEEQVVSMKSDICPQWDGNNIYLGLMIIPGCHNINNKKKTLSVQNLERDIIANLDARYKTQVLFASWNIPEEVNSYINKYPQTNTSDGYVNNFDWISITGIVLTKKRNKK